MEFRLTKIINFFLRLRCISIIIQNSINTCLYNKILFFYLKRRDYVLKILTIPLVKHPVYALITFPNDDYCTSWWHKREHYLVGVIYIPYTYVK